MFLVSRSSLATEIVELLTQDEEQGTGNVLIDPDSHALITGADFHQIGSAERSQCFHRSRQIELVARAGEERVDHRDRDSDMDLLLGRFICVDEKIVLIHRDANTFFFGLDVGEFIGSVGLESVPDLSQLCDPQLLSTHLDVVTPQVADLVCQEWQKG